MTISWANTITVNGTTEGAGGSWTTATNWSPQQIPAAGDGVLIGLPGTYAITVSETQAIATLALDASGASIDLTAGELDVGGSLENHGTISASGTDATLVIPGSLVANSGTIIAGSGATIELTGSFTATDAAGIDTAGGTLAIAGTLDNTGTTFVVGSGLGLGGGAVALNAGTIVGGTLQEAGAKISFAAGTLVGVAVDGAIDLSGLDASVAIVSGLTVTGAIDLTGPDSTLDFQNTQTFDGATIVLGSSASAPQIALLEQTDTTLTPGTLTLGPTATIDVVGTALLSGNSIISHAVVDDTGALTIAANSFTNAGTLAVTSGGGLVVDGNAFSNIGTIDIALDGTASPALIDPVSFTNGPSGVIKVDGGTLALTGPIWTNAGTIDVAGGATLLLGAGSSTDALDNDGTLVFGGSARLAGLAGSGSAIIGSGDTLSLTGAIGSSQSISFASGTLEALILGAPDSGLPAALINVGNNDMVEFAGVTVTGVTTNAGVTTVTGIRQSDSAAVSYTLNNVSFAGSPGTFLPSVDPANGNGEIVAAVGDPNFVWTGAANTQFGNALNWNDLTDSLNPAARPPGPADTANFISGGGTITGTGTVNVLAFGGAASWTLGGGAAVTSASGVTIGAIGTGQLSLTGGATIVSQGTADSISGTGGNSASLTVNGSGSLWTSDGELVVGSAGSDGTLTIQNQGSLASGAGAFPGIGLVIADTGGSGTVIVTGSGSKLTSAGKFVVGNSGFGSLDITAGAAVQTSPTAPLAGTLTEIAAGSGSDGSKVSVNGTGSTWKVSELQVGSGAFGALAITAHGTVAADTVDAGVSAGSSGIISVVGTGSTLTVTGQLTVGDASSAGLSILSGGEVDADNADIGLNAGGTGNVDIEGNGSHLNIANNLNIGDDGVGVLTLGNGTELTVANNINIGANGVLNQFGGSIDPSTITIAPSGRQGGHGITTASVEISNAGTLFASSGTETVNTPLITAPSGKTGVLEIDTSGDMVLNVTSVDATQSVAFTDGTGILTLGTIGGFAATIGSVIAGDEIIVQGTSITSDSFNSSTHVLTLLDGSAALIGTLQLGVSVNGSALLANGSGGITAAPCFVAGTRISTERGEIAVEDLHEGDRVQVVLGKGSTPIVWLGHRRVDCRSHPEPHKVWPVRVSAHAFGPGRPCRDLFLSPDHAVFVVDALIPVKHLTNQSTIMQVPVDEVTYYHIELAQHDVLLADGLPAESYLDTGDRQNFANNTGPVALYPDFATHIRDAEGCAPLLVTGPHVAAARQMIDSHATQVRLAARRSA